MMILPMPASSIVMPLKRPAASFVVSVSLPSGLISSHLLEVAKFAVAT